MIAYLDTSAVLQVLFRQPGVLESFGHWEKAYSSEVMKVEARRVIDRLRLGLSLDDRGVARAHEELTRMEQAIGFIRITRRVLDRAAGPMPTVVKTLDSIHLASALLLAEKSEERPAFATHNHQQSLAARALGFQCLG